MFDSPLLMMASRPDLLTKISEHLSDEGPHPLWDLRSIVSSPRIADFLVRDFDVSNLILVGDSYLAQHSMLADWPCPTYGIEFQHWCEIEQKLTLVDAVPFGDRSISRIQVWAFDPKNLSPEALKIAVCLSYQDIELVREPRLFGAINEILCEYHIEADPKP